MELNSIYYTFSAIPQVLAGAIALFGVFILFKVEEINKQLIGFGKTLLIEFDRDTKTNNLLKKAGQGQGENSLAEIVDDILKNDEEFKKKQESYILIRSRLEKAIDRFDLSDGDGVKKHISCFIIILEKRKLDEIMSLKSLIVNYEKKEQFKNCIIKSTISSVIWSIITIGYSIVLLPLAEYIIGIKLIILSISISLPVLACVIGIILFIINLKLLYNVISKTLRNND